MMIDTHIHLDAEAFGQDLDAVVGRALEAGVGRMITIGTDVNSSRKAVEIAENFECVFASVGIHPHDAAKAGSGDLGEIRILTDHPKVVGMGEIGLDYYYDFSPRETQQSLFVAQLQMAARLNLPVVVHVREAMTDAMKCISDAGEGPWTGVFHCFGGSAEDVPAVLEAGFHISFTGVITFKNFSRTDAVRAVPLNRLLLETDAPFMTPVPHRGKRNEPLYLRHTAERLAEIHAVSTDLLAETTTKNALALFFPDH